MPRIQSSRKARFKAACAHAGITQVDWARKEGVTYIHLYLTLKDPTQSLKLSARIDEFIAEVDKQLAVA